MEIGTKPIPISVLTAVTKLGTERGFRISVEKNRDQGFPYRFEPVGRHFNIQVMDAALLDFEVSAVRARHVTLP